MHAGEEGRGTRPQMRRQPEIETRGERGNMQAFAYAAAAGEVGLQNIDTATDDEIAKVIAGEFALAAGDRNRSRGAKFGDARLIFASHGFLEPGEITVAYEMGETPGFADRVCAVRVDHDVDIGAEGRSCRLDTFG